jgi:tRNA A-37 threonylcarbamoyl transferase component Bud32
MQNRMAQFPFQLLVKRSGSQNQTESLLCTALLRAIPGRRAVYDATWNGKNIIVKVFSHKISARRHLKKERRGLNLLHSKGLNVPKVLFYGQTQGGQQVIAIEKITESATVLDVLGKTANESEKLDLLILVCKELARQHDKGIFQKDLHLGNFLLRGDKVFMLDAGQIRFSHREMNKRKSISQLARLIGYLPTNDTVSVAKLCEEYFKVRGWRFVKPDELLLQKQFIAHKEKAVRSALKKCLRTSKRYLRVKSGKYLAVFDRSFYKEAELLDFIEQIDVLMSKGQVLKNGHTCFVSRVKWDDKDIVIKRYNHKGFIHSLRHTIKGSRAKRVWLYGHRLRMLDIATPKPLVYIEQYSGPLVWKSYLVTEYVRGQKLYDFLRDANVAEEDRSAAAQKIAELLDKLSKHRITHGDLKHSNILITNNGPVLTDLDGMKTHKWNWTCRAKQTRDWEHFIS